MGEERLGGPLAAGEEGQGAGDGDEDGEKGGLGLPEPGTRGQERSQLRKALSDALGDGPAAQPLRPGIIEQDAPWHGPAAQSLLDREILGPGEPLPSPHTASRASGLFEYQDLGSVALDHRHEPGQEERHVAAYLPTAPVDEPLVVLEDREGESP